MHTVATLPSYEYPCFFPLSVHTVFVHHRLTNSSPLINSRGGAGPASILGLHKPALRSIRAGARLGVVVLSLSCLAGMSLEREPRQKFSLPSNKGGRCLQHRKMTATMDVCVELGHQVAKQLSSSCQEASVQASRQSDTLASALVEAPTWHHQGYCTSIRGPDQPCPRSVKQGLSLGIKHRLPPVVDWPNTPARRSSSDGARGPQPSSSTNSGPTHN